jgi:TPR repeat protein
MAEKSAAQGERNGFNQLGDGYQYGIGCEKDVGKAKDNFLVAAKLGHVLLYAMVWFGQVA